MAGNNRRGVVNVADKLWEILEFGDEGRLSEFRDMFIQFSGNPNADPNNIKEFQNSSDYSLTMLQYCSQHNLCAFAEFLINENCDLTKAAGKETDPPLMIAVSEGYLDLVNLLMAKNAVLNQKNAAKQTLLHILTVRLRMESPRKKYLECLKEVLSKNKGIAAMNNAQGNFQEVPTGNSAAKGCYIQLNNMERRNRYIDVNAQDSLGNTALHYATYSDSEEVVLELLRQGASFNLMNILGDIALHKIEPSTLEKFFDSYITDKSSDLDDLLNISFMLDYSYFASTGAKPANSQDIGLETEAIWHLSRSPRHRYLLKHQLVRSFLKLKWHNIKIYNYFDFFYFSILTLLFTFVLWLPVFGNYTKICHSLMVVAFVLFTIREFGQFICAPCHYLLTLRNYITMGLFVAVASDLKPWDQSNSNFRISVIALPLIWFNLLLLLGRSPCCSTLIAMFTTVMKTFLRLFLVFSILLFGFLLSFHIVFQNPSTMLSKNDNKSENHDNNAPKNDSKMGDAESMKNENGTDSKNHTEFSNFFFLALKIPVMMTGEVDLLNIPFGYSPHLVRFILILFLFLITIVLFNLLNALAISDIQEIRKKAKEVGSIKQIDFIFYLERIITGQWPNSVDYHYLKACPVMPECILKCFLKTSSCSGCVSLIARKFLQKLDWNKTIFLFDQCLKGKNLIVYPNRNSNNLYRLCNIDNKTQFEICSCHAKFNVKNLVD